MEFSFSDEPKKGAAPATKVYAPKKRPPERPEGPPRASSRKREAAESARAKRGGEPVSAMSRIGIMFSGFLLAGMVLFTLTGYERISRAYADINSINSAIEETQLRIKALDVQIECAVTITDAQETAEAYGMSYPTQSQFVRAGDRIPAFGAASAGAGPGETVIPAGSAGSDGADAPEEPDAPTEDTPSDD